MEKLTVYLEKLGYEVEEQGRLAKYLVVVKDGIPIGFILPDFSVRLIAGAEAEHDLAQIVGFVRQNSNLPVVGIGEFLVASYRGHQMTTFFSMTEMRPQYAIYIRAANGEVTRTLLQGHDRAIKCFVSQAGMLSLSEMKGPRLPLAERLRLRLLHYLLGKPGISVAR